MFDRLQVGDFARHPFLACRELADAACHLLLISDHIVGDPVNASPHRVEIDRHRVELLLIGRSGGGRDRLSARAAIGLPSQCDSYANGKRDEIAGEGERLQSAKPAERVEVASEDRPLRSSFFISATRIAGRLDCRFGRAAVLRNSDGVGLGLALIYTPVLLPDGGQPSRTLSVRSSTVPFLVPAILLRT